MDNVEKPFQSMQTVVQLHSRMKRERSMGFQTKMLLWERATLESASNQANIRGDRSGLPFLVCDAMQLANDSNCYSATDGGKSTAPSPLAAAWLNNEMTLCALSCPTPSARLSAKSLCCPANIILSPDSKQKPIQTANSN